MSHRKPLTPRLLPQLGQPERIICPIRGETAQFTLTVQNLGTDVASNLTADVTSLDTRINVTAGNATFGNINPNESATSNALTITFRE